MPIVAGLPAELIRVRRRLLTIVCYHRVLGLMRDRFQGFRENISASPENFEHQIRYLSQHFDPISASDLGGCIATPLRLPPRPVLVTFDDGYRDNGEIAWPILKRLSVPAIVFLATDHIGSCQPFVWDLAAYCFESTDLSFAEIPLLGPTSLCTPDERRTAAEAWTHALKACPAAQRASAAELMRETLGVTIPPDVFRDLYLSWNEVRQLASEGLEFGGHTRSHPVLTRMALQEASAEIAGCRQRIHQALGHPPIAFAYPNGSRSDFAREHEGFVRDAGYQIAFSAEPGPMSLTAAQQQPMALQRIYIGYGDDMPRFAAKLAGALRLKGQMRL